MHGALELQVGVVELRCALYCNRVGGIVQVVLRDDIVALLLEPEEGQQQS